MRKMEIVWTNPHFKVTEHFTVHDCLWLGKWGRLANSADGLSFEIKSSLIATCLLGEEIRKLLGVPMIITSMYRPIAYAPLVGSGPKSPHCAGLAMDFKVDQIEAAGVIILENLERLDCRMERGTDGWIHIDRRAPGPSGRYFYP